MISKEVMMDGYVLSAGVLLLFASFMALILSHNKGTLPRTTP